MISPPKFGKEMVGRKLRLFFVDGEVCEGLVHAVPAHDDCEGCNGFVFDILSTNAPAKYEAWNVKVGSSAIWSGFEYLERYEILGS